MDIYDDGDAARRDVEEGWAAGVGYTPTNAAPSIEVETMYTLSLSLSLDLLGGTSSLYGRSILQLTARCCCCCRFFSQSDYKGLERGITGLLLLPYTFSRHFFKDFKRLREFLFIE